VKEFHEIRDPIHVFVKLADDEREVVNSRPFQRLRYIHQLALTYLVYPGATHRRFEHSLGVMELATRIFDVVTAPGNVPPELRELLPELTNSDHLRSWRKILRAAALTHDLGHLPFSHAAEKELLPPDCTHETLSAAHIGSPEMRRCWGAMKPEPRPAEIVKLALGPAGAAELRPRRRLSAWETILADIIVGDAFGADRMDYLLRDSHHAGVAYGKFDHYRLVDTMRILPAAPVDEKEKDGPTRPVLGIEEGGLHSAEALLLARYFMYTQLYFHPVRRIYDLHLKEFLSAWLPQGRFSVDPAEHLLLTDNEVTAAISKAAGDPAAPGHDPARRIVRREHYRLLYERSPQDVAVNRATGGLVFAALARQFGRANFRHDRYTETSKPTEFPVRMRDGRISAATALSTPIANLPRLAVDSVYVEPRLRDRAQAWLDRRRAEIIRPPAQETDHDHTGHTP
jgi:HD superfamily phosphohydrolase